MSNVHLLAMVYILGHKSSVILNFADIFAFAVGGSNFLHKNFIDARSFYLKNIVKTCALEDTMMKLKTVLVYPEFQAEMYFL